MILRREGYFLTELTFGILTWYGLGIGLVMLDRNLYSLPPQFDKICSLATKMPPMKTFHKPSARPKPMTSFTNSKTNWKLTLGREEASCLVVRNRESQSLVPC